MKKIQLNLGCGLEIRKGFINVDKFYTEEQIKKLNPKDVEKGGVFIQADILKLPFKDNYADYVELMNTIEHFPMKNVINYIKEIYRVMKKGAKLVILTNNMDGLALDWLDLSIHPPFDPKKYNDVAETIYGNQNAGGEIHLCPFTPSFMDYVLSQAGFKNGTVAIIKKNTFISSCPKSVSRKIVSKNAVARNDLIYVEVIK